MTERRSGPRVRVGTSGYAYKEWKGTFYPEKVPANQMLRFYAEHFETVEINNTFYRMPSEKVLLAWAEAVNGPFVFVLKASQRITHHKRLKGADEELSYFLKTASVLGNRLGPTLFQLPPNMKKDVQRLREFISALPRRWRAAFEFRHRTWFDDEVYEALKEGGAALCIADTDAGDDPPVIPTTGWGYLRLRREGYTEADLAEWAKRVSSQPWEDAFVYFKHEDKGTGPQLAKDFLRIMKD